jgi:iron complex outermembrane recepter protein
MLRHFTLALVAVVPVFAHAQDSSTVLPPVEVIGASPLLGAGIDRNKAPAANTVVNSDQVSRTGIPNALGALDEQVPGVSLDDAQGNAFQPNLIYRGFSASPLDGNPQGLAVYVNGVRFNQPFSDTVNWDLLPSVAIDRMNLEGSNPVFGLNALGGSLSIQLKNGFTWQGTEGTIYGGSFGTIAGNFQYGRQADNTSTYVAVNAQHSNGWRQFNSSDVRQLYGDVGWRGDSAEVHFNVLLDDNRLNGPGTTPVELLAVDRSAQFTAPNLTTNKYALISLSGSWDLTDQTSLQGVLYYSNLSQRISNGNTTDAQPCAATPGFLCTSDGNLLFGRDGSPITNFLNGGPYAQLNTQAIDTNGYGAALQATYEGTIAGRHNKLISGASFDGGQTTFSASSAIGGIDLQREFVGPGVVVDQPDGSIAPVRLGISNASYGVYAVDVLDVTEALSLSLSGRLNAVNLDLSDQIGTSLNGAHTFVHFNPGIGVTYRLLPSLTLYGSYAVANRAPSPAELSCASSLSPCTLANFFVGDPSLKQVVAHTFELGVRGQWQAWGDTRLEWNVDAFHTTNNDDILAVSSTTAGFSYFQNIGQTLRQGVEAGVTLRGPSIKAWLNYAFTDATFQTGLTLDSPLNPGADANGQIHVVPGDRLPGIPRHNLKVGLDYMLTTDWTLGFAAIVSSGRFLFGDEANLTPTTGAYAVLSVNARYQVTKNLQLFAVVQNVLNTQYATYGTFSATSSIPIAQVPGASNTRSLTPGAPVAGFAGVTATF